MEETAEDPRPRAIGGLDHKKLCALNDIETCKVDPPSNGKANRLPNNVKCRHDDKYNPDEGRNHNRHELVGCQF